MQKVKPLNFFLILTCYLWFTSGAFSQDLSYKNEVQFQWGFRKYDRQDLLFSPMLYQGNSFLNARLTYRRQSKRTTHLFSLGGGLYDANSGPAYEYLEWRTLKEAEVSPTTFILMDFNYSFLKNISKSSRLNLSAGGSLENGAGAFFYGYGAQSFFGYTLTTGIGPAMLSEYKLGVKQKLEVGLYFPVTSWLARSPYAINDDRFIANQSSHRTLATLGNLYKGGNIVTINKLQKLNWMFSYRYALSNRWTSALVYQGEYFRFTEPRKFVAIRNDLSLNITYLF